jgi:hypothetical protein
VPRRNLPLLCFDSAICINRSKGRYPDSEWRTVWKFVVSNFQYAIIPLILTELMLGVGRGDEAHFDDNRRALQVLYPTHKKLFLDMPGMFATQTVLGWLPSGDFLTPDTFRDEAQILMRATSKGSLISGRVQMRGSRKYSRGMDFSLLSGQMERGQKDHIDTLEKLRAGQLLVPPVPAEWARLWMRSLGLNATEEECARMAAALDAAYRYECFLWDEARVGKYDFSKHASDWIDSQLLYYLAEPTMHILVHDRKLRQRIAGSTQANRVFDYSDFVALATSPGIPFSAHAATG